MADTLRLLNEGPRPLELAGARALRHVAGDGHHIEFPLLDQRFDRLVLLGHCGMPEVEIRAMKQAGDRHSLAMMASVNSSVDACPPRSRVSVVPSRIVVSSAARTRRARSPSPT